MPFEAADEPARFLPDAARPAALRLLACALSAAAFALAPRRAAADVFAFRDAQGTLQITNRPGGDRRYRLFVKSTPREPRASEAPRPAATDGPARYAPWIRGAAARYAIPVALIQAVIECESDYDPRAVSAAGAEGLMQLMPETAERMGVRDAFDPRESILGGARYLRVLCDLFAGDLPRAVAAYNAGEAAVVRYAGSPPYKETQGYVARVLARYRRYRPPPALV